MSKWLIFETFKITEPMPEFLNNIEVGIRETDVEVVLQYAGEVKRCQASIFMKNGDRHDVRENVKQVVKELNGENN